MEGVEVEGVEGGEVEGVEGVEGGDERPPGKAHR